MKFGLPCSFFTLKDVSYILSFNRSGGLSGLVIGLSCNRGSKQSRRARSLPPLELSSLFLLLRCRRYLEEAWPRPVQMLLLPC